jgi:hypothetical protein
MRSTIMAGVTIKGGFEILGGTAELAGRRRNVMSTEVIIRSEIGWLLLRSLVHGQRE